MNKYTIYCTKEQTIKAYELGAPIDDTGMPDDISSISFCHECDNGEWVIMFRPTAEQTLGWLRSQGFRFRIKDLEESTHWEVTMDGWIADGELSTPEYATLAAIDAALDYLIKNDLIK